MQEVNNPSVLWVKKSAFEHELRNIIPQVQETFPQVKEYLEKRIEQITQELNE